MEDFKVCLKQLRCVTLLSQLNFVIKYLGENLEHKVRYSINIKYSLEFEDLIERKEREISR